MRYTQTPQTPIVHQIRTTETPLHPAAEHQQNSIPFAYRSREGSITPITDRGMHLPMVYYDLSNLKLLCTRC
ncbi:Uncharacterised protein [Chlamydia abortus]|nr:Uncharacterised protein [Chlamydia abortus]